MSRVRKLGNGNLFITEAQYGDAGLYGCTATNQFGSDTSFGELKVIRELKTYSYAQVTHSQTGRLISQGCTFVAIRIGP